MCDKELLPLMKLCICHLGFDLTVPMYQKDFKPWTVHFLTDVKHQHVYYAKSLQTNICYRIQEYQKYLTGICDILDLMT